jgi:riboflavin transporter FmnP
MGCMGFVLVMIARALLALGEIPLAIWGSVAVGFVVGLILALVKGDGFLIFTGCGVGFVVGLVLELIIILIVRINNRRSR